MASPKRNSGFQDIDTSISSNLKSPRKCNFSFSFNFDLESVISESSTDSETADLQIDVAEVDDYELARKRARIEIDETSAINEMEEEIERQLDAKAAKTNLTATNVKNILKHVITNEHVLAMVQNRLQNTDEGMVFEPKLTRAKAKELALTQPNMPWPMTPIKNTSSLEVQELIDKDLSEDSSDEEYSPEQDQQSDDEAEGESLTNSDIDSQPSTPATSGDTSQSPEKQAPPDSIHYDSEGIFKIPEVPHVPTEVESIGQRTRSKLCLSETPLEQIEQAFIPPDITTDMYDWDCDIDEDWGNFLNEFTKPLGHDALVEDDPEADPEYNILEDKETDLLDKEELRMDKAVKVTRKELNDLVAELFEFEDMYSNQQTEMPKKRKSADNSFTSVSNTSMNNCMVDLLPALAEPELPKLVSAEQVNLLATQLRQHVQLMTQHFGMTYMHPEFDFHATICKDNLNSLSYLRDGSDSAFNVENLPDALKFVNDWETILQDPKFREEYTEFVSEEIRLEDFWGRRRNKYAPKFHLQLVKIFVECKALMYPQLLPHTPFRTKMVTATRASYCEAEVSLIALGLEGFTPFVAAKKSKFKSQKMQLMDVVQMITQYILPCRPPSAIIKFIHGSKARHAKPNPIKHFYETGSAPKTVHYITLNCELVAPQDQPRSLLPPIWQDYLKQLRAYKVKSQRKKNAQSSISRFELAKPSLETFVDESLRNPVVNMLPSVPYTRVSSNVKVDSVTESSEDGNSVDESFEPSRSPQLRKTTPRLAKIRSAQNMKLMTQVSGTKPLSNCSRLKSRAKSESSKDSEESCGSTKGDNEDEIAELMLASTTIKKDTASRKKAKQARELENIKRLREAENETAQEERDTKFAESYIQKLLITLESSNMETLKAVIKSYSEYSDKFDSINQLAALEKSPENPSPEQSIQTKQRQTKIREEKDILTINLYKDVCNHLRDYPELRSDFLLFLKPHHAAMIDELTEHTMLQKMNEFMNVAQIYFAKQPSRLARVMKAITQLASDRYVTMADVHAAMDPILRGHPLVMDMFLQVLPTGKPPDSLFASHLFENLTCPMGPYDKHKVYTEDSPEMYENIELPLPSSQEDPYGGDNCKCDCHDSSDSNLKTVTEHCVSCGTRFLNGRIYLQTSEGLRPAKITFPGDDEEKLENIARVSLKTTERFASAPPTSRRRKSSKNESGQDESSQKQSSTKSSPIKDSDEGDKGSSKSRRGARSPPKTSDQRKLSKAVDVSASAGTSAATGLAEPTSPLKSKRETRAERREAKLESKNTGIFDTSRASDAASSGTSEQWEESAGRASKSFVLDSSDSEANVSCEKMETSVTEPDSGIILETDDATGFKPWTRQEDMIILQNIKKDYSESTISAMLGDRTVEQVKQRFQTLLSLLEKMT